MKKIIILLIGVFILTGCSAEYNLVYENNTFKENLKVTSFKDNNFINEINDYYNRGLIVDYKVQLGEMSELEYISKYGGDYKKNIIDFNDTYGLELNYDFSKSEEYLNSSIVYRLFENIYIYNNIISVSKTKNIFDSYNNLNEIKISFKTDKNVININSDEEIDGVYYWYINKDNYKDKEIKIQLEEKGEKLIDSNGYLTGNVIKYILMLITILFLIGIIFIYEKIKKSNN